MANGRFLSTTVSCPACLEEGKCSLTERLGEVSMYQCPGCGHEFAYPLTYTESYYDDAHSKNASRIRLAPG